MSVDLFISHFAVSHETITKLKRYQELVLKWNKAINLIAKSTEQNIWQRHIFDSAQLIKYITNNDKVLDIGSGAGLPGIVLSIMGMDVTMVESDIRKCIFLKEVIRELDIKGNVRNERIESLNLHCNLITARGFSSLRNLFFSTVQLNPAKMVLLKGQNIQEEILEAQRAWNFTYKMQPSLTSDNSYIIIIEDISKNDQK